MDSKVTNVVDRYLSVVLVDDLNKDAGWRRSHQIDQLIAYKGDLPRCTGGIGEHDDQMINQVSMMFDRIVSPYSQWCTKAMELLQKRNSKRHDCLVADVYYSKRPNIETGSDFHSQAEIAAMVGLSRAAYQDNVYKGAQYVRDLVDLRNIEAA